MNSALENVRGYTYTPLDVKRCGVLLRIVGSPRRAIQYNVSNPLVANEMTRHTIGAVLYAPLHVLI